jgi:EmrB/QacA subfamily drug resistance transporter
VTALRAAPRRLDAPWLVLALAALSAALTGISLSVMSVAGPAIVEAFPDASPAKLSWVTNIFTIVGAATLVPAGVLADRWGRKRLTLAGVAIFLAGSTLAALATVPEVLILGRGIQALGSAAYTPASAALMIAAFPPERLTAAIGVWAITGAVSSTLGPIAGGLAIDLGGWSWAFWIVVPFGAIVLALGPRVFREAAVDRSRRLPDPLGAGLIIVGTSLLTLGVVKSPQWGWVGERSLAAFAGGLAVLGYLVWRCLHRPNPILDLTMLRIRTVAQGNLGVLTFGLSWFGMFFGLAFFVTTEWDYSPLRTGIVMAPMSLVSGFAAITAGRFAERVGHRVFMVPGLALYLLTTAWVWRTLDTTPNLATFLPAVAMLGLASGLSFPMFIALGVTGVEPDRHAVASGLSFTTQRIGTTLGVSVAITMIAAHDGTAGLHRLLVMVVVGAALAVIVAATVDTRPSHPSGPSP